MAMETKKLVFQDREIKYNLKRSRRAKKMRLTIYCDGNLVATVPQRYSDDALDRFILEKAGWILKKIDYFNNFAHKKLWKNSPEDFLLNKDQALELAESRAQHFSDIYGLRYKNISIRNQKTRWGSCSRSGNLSFNYKIIFLPEYLADYIIVHEICHLREFNHSARFWSLVEKTMKDYKKLRREVRKL